MRSFAVFAVHRDRIEPNWSTAASMNAALASRTFPQRVDHARPHTGDPGLVACRVAADGTG